jgi:hypothetical protein
VTSRRSLSLGFTFAALCAAFTAACGSDVARSTSSPAPGTATCTAAQLTVTANGSAAATGHSELIVELANRGPAPCTLSGFPTVSGTVGSGAVVHGVDTTNVFLGMANPGSGPSPVTLAPGVAAWVPLNFLDNPINGAVSCPSFSSFTVRPPDVDRTYTVQAPDGGAGRPPDCDGIRVPPVLSAAAAVIP